MGAFSQEMGKAVEAGGVQATIGGTEVTMNLSGVSWIAKGVPGSAEYAAFYKGAGEKGWIFTDPRAAKGSPRQAKAMAQMYTEFAKLGGLPVETNKSMVASGEEPVAAMMSRMGPITTNTVIDSVDEGALDDALFQVPADYTLKQR